MSSQQLVKKNYKPNKYALMFGVAAIAVIGAVVLFLTRASTQVISFRDSSSMAMSGPNGNESIAVIANKPSKAQPGDLLLAQLTFGGNGDPSTYCPSGWSSVKNTDAGSHYSKGGAGTTMSQIICSRFTGTNEPSSYDFRSYTVTRAVGDIRINILAYSGVDKADPFVASDSWGGENPFGGADFKHFVSSDTLGVSANQVLVGFLSSTNFRNDCWAILNNIRILSPGYNGPQSGHQTRVCDKSPIAESRQYSGKAWHGTIYDGELSIIDNNALNAVGAGVVLRPATYSPVAAPAVYESSTSTTQTAPSTAPSSTSKKTNSPSSSSKKTNSSPSNTASTPADSSNTPVASTETSSDVADTNSDSALDTVASATIPKAGLFGAIKRYPIQSGLAVALVLVFSAASFFFYRRHSLQATGGVDYSNITAPTNIQTPPVTSNSNLGAVYHPAAPVAPVDPAAPLQVVQPAQPTAQPGNDNLPPQPPITPPVA